MKRTLFLIVNTRCDLACKYCFYSTGHEKRNDLTVDPKIIPEVARKLKYLGFHTIILTGGEPLSRRYRDRVFEIIGALKRFGFFVIVNTSGAYLDEENCERLLEAAPDRIDFSVDSFDPSVHDFQRGKHSDTVDAISYLLNRQYLSIVVTTVVTAANQNTIQSIVKYFKGLGVQDCRLQPAFLPAGFKRIGGPHSPQMNEHLWRELVKIAQDSPEPESCLSYYRYWSRYFSPNKDASEAESQLPSCQMGKSTFVAESNWTLKACFHRSDPVIGNLLFDSLDSIEAALTKNPLSGIALPSCVGSHCVSLFSRPQNWSNVLHRANGLQSIY